MFPDNVREEESDVSLNFFPFLGFETTVLSVSTPISTDFYKIW
jgi:hypothetical protein